MNSPSVQGTGSFAEMLRESAGAIPSGFPGDLLQLALTSADTVLYRWNLQTGELVFSDNMAEVFPFSCGFPRNEEQWASLIDPADRPKWDQQKETWLTRPVASSNYRYRLHHEGESLWIRQSAVALEAGKILVGVIYFRTLSPQPQLQAQNAGVEGMRVSTVSMPASIASTRRERFSDYIYPEEFVLRLQEAINTAHLRQRQGALLILSIANFGMIINAFGHSASETVMHELAAEIKKMLGSDDSMYRIHRDQFGIILADCPEIAVENRANQLGDIVRQYGYRASVGALHAICGIGSMFFPHEHLPAPDIIDKAYIALHKTSNGIVHRGYSEGPDDKTLARQQMGLANYLRKAIEDNKLCLAYQPIITSLDGQVAHYEALLRLIGDDGKISSAGALIPIAERMGLIDMVDHLVLEMVVKELEQSDTVQLAFNVSNLTTDNEHWLAHCQRLLHDRPEIASRLMVEITETAAHRDLRRTAYFVASLQELGCKIALDDFGSGYTSFRQLKALSVDYIKIDGSFVKDLTDNPDNRFFVRTLLEFTRCFNLKSVAECVENGETAKILMELGVDYMQGYYFGRPENYRSWLA